MKSKYGNRSHLLASIFICLAPCAIAATETWDGTAGDNNWLSPTNWASDTAFPGATSGFTSADDAIFSLTGATGVINLGDLINLRTLEFGVAGGNAAAFSIGDANDVLNFTTAGGIRINAGVTTAQTIGTAGTTMNLSTAVNSSVVFTNNGTGLLTIGGNIVANPPAGNSLLTVTGTGNTTVTGTITETGAGGSALLKTGSGTLKLTNGSNFTGTGAPGRIPATAASFPLVVREGTLLLDGGIHTIGGEAVIGGVVADGSTGQNARIQIDSGTLDVAGWLSIGRGNGIGAVSSDLVANNASVINAQNLSAGFDGGNATNLPKGSIQLNNSSSLTISGNGAFFLGESTGSNITMTLNGSSQLNVAGTGAKRIGNLGTGVLNINDSASVNFGNQTAYLGYRTGNGTLNMTGGTLSMTGELRVGGSDLNGAAPNGSGTFTISGGTTTLGSLTLARGNNNQNTVSGTGTISGGTVNSVNDVTLGYAGNNNLGKLTISGGTLNVGTLASKWLMVGRWDTSRGQLDITSGAINLLNNTALKMNADGTTGANVVNQSGGSITFYSDAGTTVGGTGDLDMQRAGAAASNNTYNLNGGTLTVPRIISTAVTGTRTFNFNGGTLKAAGSTTTFMNLGTGNARANVRDGGAKIDTNGFDVTIAQALVHSDIGGDSTTDGGVTKQGGGTLTFTNSNTYTGVTSITGGKLLVNGSHTGGGVYDVGGASTLGGTGSLGTSTLNVSGVLAPGASVETLASGTVNFTTGSTFAYEVDSAALAAAGGDLQVISGDLSLTGTVNLTLADLGLTPAAFAPGTVFSLINYSGAWNGGLFTLGGNSLADDSTFTVGLNTWQIDYNAANGGSNFSGQFIGGSDSFVNITAVPEPRAAFLGVLGLLALVRRRRPD
ncbi:MAG: hypothetical protein EOP88_09380 [Verrucomicrobiaceae bacterium]|nr:MAG: hypothetical protein EOP88_09380 [Verrucomicrobiaceae bacterium]